MATITIPGIDKTVQLVSVIDQTGAPTSTAAAVDSNNSTSTPLLAAAVFTGTATDVSRYASMNVSIFTDQASATNGLAMQQSCDGTNWDIVDSYTVASQSAGGGKTYSVQSAAKWFRVVYTNGGTNQGAFRLQTLLKIGVDPTNSVKASDGYSNENDLQQAAAHNMVLNPAGTWDRQRAGPYQFAQTPLVKGSGNVANASAAVTLTGTSTTTVYLAGFQLTASGATTGLDVVATVTGILGGTLSYVFSFPAGALVGATPLVVSFTPPIPASAVNTPIVVTLPAGGTGNTNAAAVAYGFYQ